MPSRSEINLLTSLTMYLIVNLMLLILLLLRHGLHQLTLLQKLRLPHMVINSAIIHALTGLEEEQRSFFVILCVQPSLRLMS
jgi:hypothetical protein